MKENTAISVSNVGKKYAIGSKKEGDLRSTLANILKSASKKGEEFWALQNLNFEIQKGEVVGIIGRNGAGKSTLLKILSQITKPSTGRIVLNGRVASLLEVGTGFHPELTGRENIYLNGTILGMTRKEVKSKFNEIVEFSGVEKFIDTAVKHYSSGMYVRLAFAVAAHLEPEILIVDEVLAVGDAEFQKKCLGKMKDVASTGRTVLFVSHHLGSIKKLCSKGILLEQGKIVISGDIEKVITAYQQQGQNHAKYLANDTAKDIFLAEADISASQSAFHNEDEIRFEFKINFNLKQFSNVFLLLRLLDNEENVIGSSEIELLSSKENYAYTLPSNTLVKGNYKLNCIIYQPGVAQFDNVAECCNFDVLDNNSQFSHLETFDIGNMYLSNNWK